MAYKYEGFWRAMDTLRDRQVLEEMVERGETPWRMSSRLPHQGKAGHEGAATRSAGERLSVLCLGAHSDDIEIGAGATLLSLIERGVFARCSLVRAQRCRRARERSEGSAADFLAERQSAKSRSCLFGMAFFQSKVRRSKLWFEDAKGARRSRCDLYASSQ